MNTNTINNLASIGSTMQSAGSQIGNTVMQGYLDQKRENERLQESFNKDQVKQVVNLFEQYTMGEGGTLKDFTKNISERQLANFDASADEAVWDSAIENISEITGNVYSQEIIDEALKTINTESKSKYAMLKSQYKNTSMITALKANFATSIDMALSEKNEDGSFRFDSEDASESAKMYISAYNDSSIGDSFGDGGFDNFDIMNKDGSFSATGENGKNLIADIALNNHISSIVTNNATKGDMYTQQMIMDEVEEWGSKFCAELGMSKADTEAFIAQKQNEALTALATQKKNLQIHATEAMNNATALMDQIVRTNGYRSIADIPIEDRLAIMEQAGLGDWNENAYSYEASKDIVSKMYEADMQLHRKDVMAGIDAFDNGAIEGLDFDIDSLSRVVVAGTYDGREVTTYSVTMDGDNFQSSEEFTSEMDLAMREVNRLYSNTFNDLAESQTGLAPSITTMFGKEVDAICEKLGITDAWGKYTIAQHLENKVQENMTSGKFATVQVTLDAKLKDDMIEPALFNAYVDQAYREGYISKAQRDDYIEQKSFTQYKNEYENIESYLRNNLIDASFILSRPETRKFIRDTIMAKNGDTGQETLDYISRTLSAQYADDVTLDVLSKGLKIIANPAEYSTQVLESLGGGYNVSRIMGDYVNGAYAELGVDSIIPYLRKELIGIAGSTRTTKINSTHAEYICETAWKQLGYGGTYAESKKDDPKREVVEKASLIAMAYYAQEKNMQSQFGNSMGNGSFSTIFQQGTFGGVAQVSLTGDVAYCITENGEPKYVVGHLSDEWRDYVLDNAKNGVTVPIQSGMFDRIMGDGPVAVVERTPYTQSEIDNLNYSLGIFGKKNYRYVESSNGRLGVEKYDQLTDTWYNAINDDDLPVSISTTISSHDANHVKPSEKIKDRPEYKQFMAQSLPWNK